MPYEDNHFIDTNRQVWNYSFFTDDDIKNFKTGNYYTAYEKFGSHYLKILNTEGYYFAVWAPNAKAVSVIGDFNGWKKKLHPLSVRLDKSGIWEGFIPHFKKEQLYKYHITGLKGSEAEKADPYANFYELRPATASIAWNNKKQWNDNDWMANRKKHNALNAPWTVYEVHLGSWMRPEKNKENLFNTYAQITERLVPYVKGMGFTHIEIMPIMEYPYDPSWGYQCTGYFAPTSRFGKPEEFMDMIDAFHQNNIGVILDWVPSHFPKDDHGLYLFDGEHTYEYADMQKGFHPDWNSYIFNYERGEVVSFLLSSAHYWFKNFHIDGIRVDAVNSIMRLDFSRKEGEWVPNINGGNENLEAIAFLKKLNEIIYREFPDVQTIAEEASDWPDVTKSVNEGGIGFGMKWMMGWMHDTFNYFKLSPNERPAAQDKLTFSMIYFYSEKFMLPISHDEVVYGKSPMIYKVPGTEQERFASIRLMYVYMFTHPGAKLLFMGNEFGQTSEWDFNSELDWELLQHDPHEKLQHCVKDLNYLYNTEPAMYECQFDKKGFEWLDLSKPKDGIITYYRKGENETLLVILNISAKAQAKRVIRVKGKSEWKEIFNTNDEIYWGSGEYLNKNIKCKLVNEAQNNYDIIIDIPPLSALVLK